MKVNDILNIVEETFDEEISSSCNNTVLGLESWVDGKEEFMKKLAEKLNNKCPLSDPALKLAGKMAIAAETVINSKATTISYYITLLENALNEYNNEIFSRIK